MRAISLDNSISIILTIYNQDSIIASILNGIWKNISNNVKEIIIVFDGCTDMTKPVVMEFLNTFPFKIPVRTFETPNIWETKANNFGFMQSSCKYSLTIQDDIMMTEKDFDKRLLKPFLVIDDLLGVTGRNAQDEGIDSTGKLLMCSNVFGKDVSSPRNKFGIRDVIVRGPILFDNDKLQSLGYLDEEFAPIDSDDKDLSFRAWRKGWIVGAYMVGFESPVFWGKTRNNAESNRIWAASCIKNQAKVIERHKDLILGKKHGKDIEVE
jgi:glycosyltransferase involved in cell wall biosynthesis